jgi:hypothetical protein
MPGWNEGRQGGLNAMANERDFEEPEGVVVDPYSGVRITYESHKTRRQIRMDLDAEILVRRIVIGIVILLIVVGLSWPYLIECLRSLH